MNSPDTFGLTVTNSVLGVVVLVTLLLTVGAVVWELIARVRRRPPSMPSCSATCENFSGRRA
jgi:hypothetical protein